MSRILLLGGTGFLGSHVARRLAELGHDLCVFHRGETESEVASGLRHVHGNFGSFAEHVPDLRSYAPDVVIDIVPFHDKNGHGVTHFTGVATRAIVITSVDVYRAFARGWGTEPGPPDPVPLTEDSPLRDKPSRDLGEEIDFDNVEVERAVRGHPVLPTTVLRMAAIYGPKDAQHRLFSYVKRMEDRRPAILLDARLTNWRWSRVFVRNAAEAVVLAAVTERSAGRTYNVGPVYTETETEWVSRIAEAHGWRGDVLPVASEELPDHLRVPFDTGQDVVLDSSRIREELSYVEQVPMDEALRTTIEWERRNPPASLAPPAFDYEAEDAVLARLQRDRPSRLRRRSSRGPQGAR